MAVTIKDIEKNRPNPKKKPLPLDSQKNKKEDKRVLRPWESFQKEEDLLELITKRATESSRKKKVLKKEFVKNNSQKEKEISADPIQEVDENLIDQMEGISDDLKKRLKELRAELQSLNP